MLLFVVTQLSKYSKLNSRLLLLNKKMLSGSLTAKKIDFRQCFSLILSKVKIFPCFTNSPHPNSPKERFPDPEISRLRQPPSSSFLTNPQEKRKQETPRRTPFCLLVVIIIWQFYPLEPLSAVVLCVFLFFPGSYLHAYCFISLPNVWPVYVTRTPRQKLTVSCWVPPSRGGMNSAHTTFIESVYFNPCFVSV